jgi:1,4-dihydroxy-2-naphthoate octaprenyltransferase
MPLRGEQAWGIIRMTRPIVLLSTFSSWFLGVGIAFGSGYQISYESFGFGLFSMLLVSSSIHLINEYADYETDALTQRTAYNGGSGVLPSGLVPRSWALYSAYGTMIAGYLVQYAAIFRGLHPFNALKLAIIGTVGGWVYSIPPRLAWRGLGEVWNTILGAWLLPYYGFIQMSGVDTRGTLIAVLPVTLFAFNNMLAVTWPDREADKKVGKNTLATWVTLGTLKALHGLCTVTSLVILLMIGFPRVVVYASLVSYPLMALGWRSYGVKEISVETIWALYLLIVAQTLAWFYLGIV